MRKVQLSDLILENKPRTSRFRDLEGQFFTRLTVEAYAGRMAVNGLTKRFWLCRCRCGRVVLAGHSNLLTGHVQSCGCLRAEQTRASHLIHGHAGANRSRAYAVWSGMLSRCGNPNHPAFHRYGGRGIRVCRRWRSFKNFLTDMGEPPARHSLDRQNNDQGYRPGNCRWVRARVQSRNTSRNRWLSYGGVTLCLVDWAKRLRISYSTLNNRLKNGWPLSRALTTRALR